MELEQLGACVINAADFCLESVALCADPQVQERSRASSVHICPVFDGSSNH